VAETAQGVEADSTDLTQRILLAQTIGELQQLAFDTAELKGWHRDPINEQSVPLWCAMIHSELSEALDAYFHGSEALGTELADVVIRIMDDCAQLGLDLEKGLTAILAQGTDGAGQKTVPGCQRLRPVSESLDVPLKIALAHFFVSQALEADRKSQGPEALLQALVRVVLLVMDICQAKGMNLDILLVNKMRANLERPYRHGGLQY